MFVMPRRADLSRAWHTGRRANQSMDFRSSEPSIPSIAGRPRDKIRALGTGAHPTPMQGLTQIVAVLGRELDLRAAVAQLQKRIAGALKLRDALCFWIDWPNRIAWTLSGRVHHGVEEQVIEVAGSGKRSMLAGAVIEPIGPPPTRAVLALRKPSGIVFTPNDLIVIQTLAQSIAPALDALIRAKAKPT
jgi:hypothetical protein